MASETDAPKEEEAAAAPAATGDAKPAAPPQVEVNDKDAISLYANFCRVTGTPEELIIDFGLNSQPMGVPTDPLQIKQRLILNFFTAKRLLSALHMSIQRHEAAFGVLETDIRKRLKQQPPQA